MSNSRDPFERQAARGGGKKKSNTVYWIRRAIALTLVAVLVWLGWTAVSAIGGFVNSLLGGGSDKQTNQAVTDGKISACDPAKLELVPLVLDGGGASAGAFDIGINPYFSYSITNTGKVDCTFDLGTKETYFTVSSGSETIWYSGDCQGRESLAAYLVTLKAGETKKSTAGEWYRVHSSSSGCGAEQDPVIAAGASYHLSVSVSGQSSKTTQQFLLN